jgi:HEAT repeat protein
MRLVCPIPFFASLLLLLPYGTARAEEETHEEERTLREAGLPTDGPALITFFQRRAQLDVKPGQIDVLIHQLGAAQPTIQEAAVAALVGTGVTAIPLLRQAAKDGDNPEVAQRARRCLDAIRDTRLPAAAARRLARLKPAGAVQAVLAFLPFADDQAVLDEVETSLNALALPNGQAEPALVAALEDAVPVRRAAAALALCHAGGFRQARLVRKLLHDPKPTVRLRVALALAGSYESDAIPVLIALLSELPEAQGKRAEETLQRFAGEQGPAIALTGDDAGQQKCRTAWAEWWAKLDDARLLTYFRTRTLGDAERKRMEGVIRRLGDEDFEVREKASEELLALGDIALPLVQRAAHSSDAEVVRRAEDCLRSLERKGNEPSAATAARLLALRRPDGAAGALLGYLPLAEEETTSEAVRAALVAIAQHQDHADPALVQALADRSPLRRSAAAEALCRAGLELSSARKLLEDRDPDVRMRTAVALAGIGEKEAVPVLIGLLMELPAAQRRRVDDLLQRLAGGQGPAPSQGDDQAARRKDRDAWSQWWHAHASAADLSRLANAPMLLGLTLLVQLDSSMTTGRVSEVGRDGRPRWQIAGLRFPVDAQVLPGNRVLIAEFHGMRVTERDFKGNILWERPVTMPVNCQRLANGHTLIAARNQVYELDRNQKEVFTYTRSSHDLMAARKLRDGQVLCITTSGMCLILDAHGRVVRSFSASQSMLGALEVEPDGHFLLPQLNQGRIMEFDGDGAVVWKAAVPSPNSAVRLRNGNTLVASQNRQCVVEVDRNGNVVWELKTEARPWRAWRR